MMGDMPKGLPAAGDRGLDNTHTWGRTYWGGALYYLIADVRIRERTGNRFGLQDGFRAVVAQGGSVEVAWDVRRPLTIADKATGTNVLTELYDEMRAAPVMPDLAQLWKRLGVKLTPEGADFDDDAPLAAVRKAITAGYPARPLHRRPARFFTPAATVHQDLCGARPRALAFFFSPPFNHIHFSLLVTPTLSAP